ncbi:hypothetical protein ACN6MY_15145 [Peribacillus sp. B-H-3]|uniref:hypothetical protein n=1 Tax=Peribacillus sp. B-H-3 TaxID=3400420 RepID=UPI003B020C15
MIANNGQMDWKGLEESVRKRINKENPPKLSPQIFDVKTSKKFSFSFVLSKNVSQKDIKIYYVHTREEPMDSLEFWIKEIELK